MYSNSRVSSRAIGAMPSDSFSDCHWYAGSLDGDAGADLSDNRAQASEWLAADMTRLVWSD